MSEYSDWYYRTYLNPPATCPRCKQEYDMFQAYGGSLGTFCTSYCYNEYKREQAEGVSLQIVAEINLSGIRKGFWE